MSKKSDNLLDIFGSAAGCFVLAADIVVSALDQKRRRLFGRQDVRESEKNPLFLTRVVGFDHE